MGSQSIRAGNSQPELEVAGYVVSAHGQQKVIDADAQLASSFAYR